MKVKITARLIWWNCRNDFRGSSIRLRTSKVCCFGQHGLARGEMGIEGTVRQTRFFHDVGNTRAVIAATPDGAGRSIHDTRV